ncbi:sigma-70 family RNA polymerase sigma factor [Halomonas sp. LY9]
MSDSDMSETGKVHNISAESDGSRPTHEFDYADALARCARGEHAALHQLYQYEGAKLLGVVYRIVKDRGMAEDIVHDACLNIWQRADSFDPHKGAARTWIFSIARHLALNAIRGRDREVSVDLNAPMNSMTTTPFNRRRG